MNLNKATMIKFKDVAHLYLGCKCKTPYGIMVLTSFVMTGTHKVWFNYSDSRDFNYKILREHGLAGRSFYLTQIKPLIRPLDNMTEDESEYISPFALTGKPTILVNADMTRYLLSKYFDLFDLIPNGEALDITKQTIAQ